MSLFSTVEQREVTPEERRRSARTFWFILLLFPSVIGLMITFLSLQGRELRSYVKEAMAAAHARPPEKSTPCSFWIEKTPASVKTCEIEKKKDTTGKEELFINIILNNDSRYEGSEPLSISDQKDK